MRNPEHVIDRQRRQIAQLNAKVEELTETVRQLRNAEPLPMLPPEFPYLTYREEALVRGFMKHLGKVLTLKDLYRAVYANDEADLFNVRVYTMRLRRKLVGTSYGIETVYGRGYKMVQARVVSGYNAPYEDEE